MNTHQKIFFSCAVTLGVAAAAFASSPAPTANVAAVDHATVAVAAKSDMPEVALERAMIVGHRSSTLVASNQTSETNQE